jgi:hypothetical protein
VTNDEDVGLKKYINNDKPKKIVVNLLNKLTTNFQIHHPNNGGESMNWKMKEFYG